MSRRLRRVAAVLFVVAAGLFAVGVATESDSHSEATEVHDEGAEPAGHDEAAEASGHDEAAEGAGHDESAEGTGETAVAVEEAGHDEEGTVLGIDVESPAAVVAAVVVSLALAVGLWLLKRRWLAVLAIAFGVVFAAFDFAEITHQIDESKTGLAVLAGVIAAMHVGAAATAGLSGRAGRSS